MTVYVIDANEMARSVLHMIVQGEQGQLVLVATAGPAWSAKHHQPGDC